MSDVGINGLLTAHAHPRKEGCKWDTRGCLLNVGVLGVDARVLDVDAGVLGVDSGVLGVVEVDAGVLVWMLG